MEIPLEEAIQSWYRNVYRPIVDAITQRRIMGRFSGRTTTDLYLWIVKHWDELKSRYGQDFSVHDAVADYTSRYGKGFFVRMWERLRRLFR